MWLRKMNKRQIRLQKDLYSLNKFRLDNILKRAFWRNKKSIIPLS